MISPLSGMELISAKVEGIAWMGGMYPSSKGTKGEWNFGHDGIGPSTKYCVDNWPNSSFKMFSGFEIGSTIEVCSSSNKPRVPQ